MVIDLRATVGNALLWRGVYRNPKDSAPKLAKKLPDNAKNLVSEYPPKKKK